MGVGDLDPKNRVIYMSVVLRVVGWFDSNSRWRPDCLHNLDCTDLRNLETEGETNGSKDDW